MPYRLAYRANGKPQSRRFATWEDMLKWAAGVDVITKASHKGKLLNRQQLALLATTAHAHNLASRAAP